MGNTVIMHEDVIEIAAIIARIAHKGQKYGNRGDYYKEHVLPVANMVREIGGNTYDIAAAFLHDVCEDTPLTIRELQVLGFAETLLDTVCILTREKDVPYHAYIWGIGNVRDETVRDRAVKVKTCDLIANLRCCKPGDSRISRYEMALECLAQNPIDLVRANFKKQFEEVKP